jgi:hypothetical protein
MKTIPKKRAGLLDPLVRKALRRAEYHGDSPLERQMGRTHCEGGNLGLLSSRSDKAKELLARIESRSLSGFNE